VQVENAIATNQMLRIETQNDLRITSLGPSGKASIRKTLAFALRSEESFASAAPKAAVSNCDCSPILLLNATEPIATPIPHATLRTGPKDAVTAAIYCVSTLFCKAIIGGWKTRPMPDP
jgi:hypothetical protein